MEDPFSPFYNTITKRSDVGSVEADDMGSSPLYRRVSLSNIQAIAQSTRLVYLHSYLECS